MIMHANHTLPAWYNALMLHKVLNFFELIKIEHTLFALPFAYLGMLLAAGGWPSWQQFVWITIAMASARTLAMGTNRIADRVIDAQNARTAQRPLVSGRIGLKTAVGGTVIAALILILAASQLGPLPLKLLPIAVIFLVGYSYTKRFTWLSHFVLGFTDGLAPVGAWVAVRGSLFTMEDIPAWLLLATVTLWIGGFDLIYACQDAEFDRSAGLHAVPAIFGIGPALKLARVCHGLMMVILLVLGVWLPLAAPYWLSWCAISGLLVYEHRLVSPADLSRINIAFFNINIVISAVLLIAVAGSLIMQKSGQ
ncbi:MAG: putative 4-hydroxybenzoate polyprenyltransferase [Anaerolineae bacterium]|nr:putative 4-hydroxybenzoate polyprenyltransferase [Anaerolineae bacterium]